MEIAMVDGLVWAELGTSFPGTGGAYLYLGEAFGAESWRRFWSFLSLWGYAIIMPFISAFTAVSFAQYCQQFWPAMTSAETGQLNSFPHRTSLTAYRLDSGLGRVCSNVCRAGDSLVA